MLYRYEPSDPHNGSLVHKTQVDPSEDLLNKLRCHILGGSSPCGASGASVRVGFSRARSQERIHLLLIWILAFRHQIITPFVTHQWK